MPPKFGYLLEHDGRPVGAILTIYFPPFPIGGVLRNAMQSIELARRARVQRLWGAAHLASPEAKGRHPSERHGPSLDMANRGGSGGSRVTAMIAYLSPLPCSIVARQQLGRLLSRAAAHMMPLLPRARPGREFHAVGSARFGCLARVCKTAEGAHPFIFARRET